MLKFFPDIMNSVPYFKPGNNYEGWQKFYNSNNNPDMEDNKYVMNTYISVTQNYNYIFKEDADGTLKEEFRKEYGIMVGTNEEAAQDRYLYVISLLLAHFLNPNYIHGKKGGRKTRKRRKSKKSKHSKKSRRSRRRH